MRGERWESGGNIDCLSEAREGVTGLDPTNSREGFQVTGRCYCATLTTSFFFN